MRHSEVDVSGATAPWLAAGPVIDMPADLAALALPSRRFPGAAPCRDADACWDKFMVQVRQYGFFGQPDDDFPYLDALAEAKVRVQSRERNGSPASDAILFALAAASEPHLAPSDGTPFVDFLVAHKGLPYAIEVFTLMLQTMSIKGHTLDARNVGQLSVWGGSVGNTELALRIHLAHAEAGLWAQCVEQVRVGAPGLDQTRQPFLALLFPDAPDLVLELSGVPRAHAVPGAVVAGPGGRR